MASYGRLRSRHRNMKSRSVLGLRITKIASKVKGALSVVTDIAHTVNEISGKPKAHNYAAVGTIALNRVASYFNFDPTEDPTMKEPLFIPYEMRDFLRKITKQCPTEYHGSENSTLFQVSTVDGRVVIFSGSGWDVNMWFQAQNAEEHEEAENKLIHALGRITWESMGSRVEAISPDKTGAREDMVYIKPWKAGTILSSDQTRTLITRTQKFLKRGRSRSLLLYGVPGSGKSSMIRAIADEISGTVLFLDSTQLNNIDSKTLSFFLDYLAPDIVLIDDLDRTDKVSDLLSSIDRIRAACKLLMVTVNHLKKMDAAVTRAGRFDEWVKVDRVLAPGDFIPGLNDKVLKEIDNWPIAFIEELKARMEVLGGENLEEELASLRERVKTNS